MSRASVARSVVASRASAGRAAGGSSAAAQAARLATRSAARACRTRARRSTQARTRAAPRKERRRSRYTGILRRPLRPVAALLFAALLDMSNGLRHPPPDPAGRLAGDVPAGVERLVHAALRLGGQPRRQEPEDQQEDAD